MDESRIIELYAKYDNCRQVAEELGTSNEAVRRVLIKNGIKRTGNRLDDSVINAIEREYLAGVSTYEIGARYNVHHATVSKLMNKRGHYRGRGNRETRRNADQLKRAEGKRIFEEWLTSEYGDRFTCLEYTNHNTPYKLRCNKCGSEFTRWPDKSQAIRCKTCYEAELDQKRIEKEAQKQKAKQEHKRQLEEEYAKEKICCVCGSVFHSEFGTARYCSDGCRNKVKRKKELARKKRRGSWANHRKRARYYGVAYEPGISVKQLIKRDGLTCRICGGVCDPNDKNEKGVGLAYPTIDHIVAMKNGGGHTWDNVQIAHMICNSYKRDLTDDELTNEVITHAKEQAIAHKCA